MGETEHLAKFVVETTFDDLPQEIVDKAKICIQDHVGVALAASSLDIGDQIVDYTDTVAPGQEATVFGSGTASPEGAALANGILAHALDWDDTTDKHHFTHVTTQTFPATVAAAEFSEATGEEILTAYLVGVQTHYRVSKSTYPSHYLHGWHYTGTAGTFGSTAAAASILGLTVKETKHAFGIAASSSSSLRKQFGSMTKAYHAGHAAQMGLRSALLASQGLTADPDIFEGDIGYGEVMTPDEYDPSEIMDPLAEGWDITDVGFKPFPGGTLIHGAELAMQRLTEREDLHPDEVETIRVTLDKVASELLLHSDPTDAYQTLYSIEFPLACILLEREHGLDQFTDEFVTSDYTREQMAKVKRDFGWNESDKKKFETQQWCSGRVVVETTDGEQYVEEERYNPKQHSEERLTKKYFDISQSVLGQEKAQQVSDTVMELEAVESVEPLLEPLRQ